MGNDRTSTKDERWKASAACAQVDRDKWFPETGSPSSGKEARDICKNSCPVREACLSFAVTNDERYGIWGGHNMGKSKTRRQAIADHARVLSRRAEAA